MVIGTQTALHYFAAEDSFLLKSETAGALFRIDPTTFAVTEQATTGAAPPDAVNGIYTRFQWLPLLGGFAYVPRASSNFWFLATE